MLVYQRVCSKVTQLNRAPASLLSLAVEASKQDLVIDLSRQMIAARVQLVRWSRVVSWGILRSLRKWMDLWENLWKWYGINHGFVGNKHINVIHCPYYGHSIEFLVLKSIQVCFFRETEDAPMVDVGSSVRWMPQVGASH
jgi:hypothetical protein